MLDAFSDVTIDFVLQSYVHRSGRTARAKKEGVSVVFIDAKENQYYRRMCKTLNRDEDLPAFPIDSNIYNAVKLRVDTARTLDKFLLGQRKEETEKSWWKKAAEEADLEYSDDEKDSHDKKKQQADLKNKIKVTKAQLNQLLATPLSNQSFGGKYPTMSGKLKLPTDFKVRPENVKTSAINAVSKSKAEMKALMRQPNKMGQKKKAVVNKKFKKKKKKLQG